LGRYKVKCLHPKCGKEYEDDSEYRLSCDCEIDGKHGPALLQGAYKRKQIEIKKELPGIFPYIDWLPVEYFYFDTPHYTLGRPFCYKSKGLAKRLGLENLYIAFSGYWPERGANLLTRTFKEFECQASIVRYLKNKRNNNPLPQIISSAGNTGNGYNLVAHLLELPVYLVIPETGIDKLLLPFQTKPFVIMVKGDYSDAINMADKIACKTGLQRDGGVRNVARRAGLGSVMLHAVAHPGEGSGRLFDHYFQAVGSGTGAIAAWEAVQLLLGDGRYGNRATRIHIAQNSPFTPLVDSWEKGHRELVEIPDDLAKEKVFAVTADVLTNRHPPYSVAGGVFDVLTASKGSAWKVTNYQVFHGARMFRESEGVDIGPAAAVAVDALKQAILSGQVKTDEAVLLHITGGGKEIQYSSGQVYQVQPSVVAKPDQLDDVIEKIGKPTRIANPIEILKKYE